MKNNNSDKDGLQILATNIFKLLFGFCEFSILAAITIFTAIFYAIFKQK